MEPTSAIYKVATPELDKLKVVQESSQKIGEFLEWLAGEKHYVIAEWDREVDLLYPVNFGSYGLIESLLAEYYKIDLKKVEQEKQSILDKFRRLNLESVKE